MKKNRGFTLIEVILAVAVTAIAILGVISTMLVSIKQQEAAREADVASNAALQQIERIRGTTFANIQPNFAAPNDFFNVQELGVNPATPLNPNGFQGQVIITQLAPDLLDIQVVIDWPSATGAQSRLSLPALIFNNTP